MQRLILLNLDPPAHTKLRGIVSRGFTPRAIGNLRDALAARAGQIVQTALTEGTGDFVTDVACELPLQAIAELLGIPQEDRRKIFAWSNQMIGYDDPEYEGEPTAAAAELIGYSMLMAEDRKQCPRDDIVTKLVNAQLDGGMLSSDEFGFFVILLAVAGNETTRNAISHGMLAFLDHPEQWELYQEQRPETAVDEIVRWATPVTVFQRTALPTPPWAARRSRPGSGWACSTGRPTSTRRSSTIPERFDVLRSPNPQLGFGGTGTHYCLGVNLAKLEIELMFNAIADVMPAIRQGRRRGTAALRLAQRHQAAARSATGNASVRRRRHHPHREVLRAAAVGVAQRGPRAVHLVVPGLAHDLQRRLREPQQAGGADRVGAEHPARRVDRQPAADLRSRRPR